MKRSESSNLSSSSDNGCGGRSALFLLSCGVLKGSNWCGFFDLGSTLVNLGWDNGIFLGLLGAEETVDASRESSSNFDGLVCLLLLRLFVFDFSRFLGSRGLSDNSGATRRHVRDELQTI